MTDFLIDFGRQKGAQREAFWEPKRSQNRSQNEVEISKRTSCVLEATWVDFGSFWEGLWGAFLLKFYWFLYYFVEIDVFDVDSRPRAILDPKMSKNDVNLGVKREPKSIKNRPRKMIDFWIDFWSILEGS